MEYNGIFNWNRPTITKDASVKYFFIYSESSLSLFCNHPKNRIEVVVVFLGLVGIYLLRKTRKLWWMLPQLTYIHKSLFLKKCVTIVLFYTVHFTRSFQVLLCIVKKRN